MTKLKEPVWIELPMGSIKADGWIESQLRTSLNGLSGKLHEFYSYVKKGTFTGGNETYFFLNESQPYYFQASVVAIFSIRNPPKSLVEWVDNFLDYIIEDQKNSDIEGWFGPEPKIFWPRWPVLIGAMHYAEAFPEKAEKIVNFIYNFVHATHISLESKDSQKTDCRVSAYSAIRTEPQRTKIRPLDLWGAVRTAEYTLILQWLFDYHPRDKETQELLLNDMTLIRMKGNESFGDFDCKGWPAFFSEENFNKDGNGPQTYRSHGVNISMALKESALRYRITGSEEDKKESRHQWDIVYKYHGKVAGHFSADEHLAGLSPERGSETCLIVESIWSSSLMFSIFGENQDADRAERLTFNSLPAALSESWWQRQYDQQEDQLTSQKFKTNPFRDNDEESNIFGLQTNYPCCTVNHPQGLPRFISRSYLRKGDTLLHAYLIPSTVNTTLSNENAITVSAITDYPHEDKIRYSFKASKPFTFSVRIPSWSKKVFFQMGEDQCIPVDAKNDIHSFHIPAGTSKAYIRLESDIKVTQAKGAQDGVVHITKGPLVYSLPIKYTSKVIKKDPNESNATDLELLPLDPNGWKMAIDVETLKYVEKGIHGRTGVIKAKACFVKDGWDSIDNGQWNKGFPPGNVPQSGELQDVELIPYGTAKLRMTCLPIIKRT